MINISLFNLTRSCLLDVERSMILGKFSCNLFDNNNNNDVGECD